MLTRNVPLKLLAGFLLTLFIIGCSSTPETPEQFKARVESGKLTSFEDEHGVGPVKEEMNLAPVNELLADKGAGLFLAKCSTCHYLDARKTGPPLRDITKRRSAMYVMNQILNPEQMGKFHPEGKKLVAQYAQFMTIQGITHDDALMLLEFLRRAAGQASGTPVTPGK